MSDHSDPFFATTLARGLELLQAFRGKGWLSNAELAARTGLSRPTVSRLSHTLVELGYLRKGSAGRYRLGVRLLALTYPLLAEFRVRQLARPMMREFAEDAGGAVSIGVADGADLIYLETMRTTQSFPHVPEAGFSVPLYSTAIGRAAMSLMTETELDATHARVAREQPELYRDLRERALAGIAACREDGCCIALGEWRPEILAVAAPLVRTADGECLSINCGIPSYRVSAEALREEIAPRMLGLARAIRGMIEREKVAA